MRVLTGLALSVALTIAVGIPTSTPRAALAMGAPIAASGTFTANDTYTSARMAGPNLFITFTGSGSVTGTLAGSFTEAGTIIIHPDGSVNFLAWLVYTPSTPLCGGSGPVLLRTTAVAAPGGGLVGTSRTVDQAGGRTGLHAEITFSQPGTSTYTYSGTYHC